MTMPEAAPATPETPPEPVQTPAAAAPAPTPPAPAKKSLEDSLAPLDDDTKAFVLGEVSKARKEAGDSRAAAKTKAADDARAELAQTIGKALGLVADDEKADPAKLTEQLTATAAEARQAKVELAVFRAAQAASADASALLDSRSFLAKLADIDPSDSTAVTAAVAEAVAANPVFAAAAARRLPAPNPAQGSSGSGAPDVEAQIVAAQKAGDWKTVIALQNSKLPAAKQG
jgi:hypothetical protein